MNKNVYDNNKPTIECVGITTGPEGATRHVFSIYQITTKSFGVYANYGLLSGFTWFAIGYQNGLTIQYFRAAFGANYQNTEYKFPIAFANNTTPCITACAIHAAGNVNITLNIISTSKTGFKCYPTYGGGLATETFMCIAIGY